MKDREQDSALHNHGILQRPHARENPIVEVDIPTGLIQYTFGRLDQ